jgi:hypothetical protein
MKLKLDFVSRMVGVEFIVLIATGDKLLKVHLFNSRA